MPVKNAPTKKAKGKGIAPQVQADHDEEKDPPAGPKIRMPMDLELIDPMAPEEKPESDPLLSDDEEDAIGTDDTGLEEELDPFSDKYEE